MDYENGEGPAVAQKYPVDAYPSIYFMDNNGKVKRLWLVFQTLFQMRLMLF